jgi:DNA-binding NarL/FixJ family response regulator
MAPLAAPTAQAEAATQAALDPTIFASAYHRGTTADLAEIYAAALGKQNREQPSSEVRHPEPWDVLTSSEQDVARLAAQGMSNTDIARHRGVSVRTIETQMSAVLRGLGLANRHQIITMIHADEAAK